MNIDKRVFLHLFAEQFPELATRMTEYEIDFGQAIFHWFLCLFLNVLPISVTAYIWWVSFTAYSFSRLLFNTIITFCALIGIGIISFTTVLMPCMQQLSRLFE